MRALQGIRLTELFIGTIVLTSFQSAAADERGQTSLLTYHVNTTIESRFAKTDVTANFFNGQDCSVLRGFTMQLPLNARVKYFSMKLSNGCEIDSKIASEEDARESFESKVEEGKPAALLTAWDSDNYHVEVLIPAGGRTRLELHYDELLRRRMHEVEFQLPLSPGVDVGNLVVDVFINEPQSGVSKFHLDDPGYGDFGVSRTDSTATGHLELIDVTGDLSPRLLRGSYDPGELPESGILMADGYGCATLLFDPNTFLQMESIPRKIVFVIDVSGSMSGQKLEDAKAAFSTMIKTLTIDDNFAIHSFSSEGRESLFEPRPASLDAKSDAASFVNNLIAGGGTNLYGAFSEGLDRVLAMQESDVKGGQFVPVLVILTDGRATTGVKGSQEISRSVRYKNDIVNTKIFALAFGSGADFPLLLGISTQNGGKAVPVYEGFGDAADQMEGFYLGELGTILMADVGVSFGGDFGVVAQTQSRFSIFANGTEIVSRAIMAGDNHMKGILQATTTATTISGDEVWNSELDLQTVTPHLSSECSAAFAHTRIDEIMQFREGALSLGDDMRGYEPYKVTGPHDSAASVAEQARQEALGIALEAGLVWPKLTALVAVESSQCEKVEATELCTEGDMSGSDSGQGDDEDQSASAAGVPSPGQQNGGSTIDKKTNKEASDGSTTVGSPSGSTVDTAEESGEKNGDRVSGNAGGKEDDKSVTDPAGMSDRGDADIRPRWSAGSKLHHFVDNALFFVSIMLALILLK